MFKNTRNVYLHEDRMNEWADMAISHNEFEEGNFWGFRISPFCPFKNHLKLLKCTKRVILCNIKFISVFILIYFFIEIVIHIYLVCNCKFAFVLNVNQAVNTNKIIFSIETYLSPTGFDANELSENELRCFCFC